MKPEYITNNKISNFISQALAEDVGDGDFSSLSCVPVDAVNIAQLLVKQEGVLAGVELALEIFKAVDEQLEIEVFKNDGDQIKIGDIVLKVHGKAQSILKAERLVLNCMQRMSGIATKTNQLVQKIKDTKAKLLDTRKTTPNFRIFEKWAVLIGGGINHRMGLFDMIMLKDNHIAYAGGIAKAIISTKSYLENIHKNLRIEIETQNLEELKEVLSIGGVDIVMLDNMTPDTMKQAVQLINGRFLVEASGGITEENIHIIAETGVDYISVGALTHSYQSLDLSLKATHV